MEVFFLKKICYEPNSNLTKVGALYDCGTVNTSVAGNTTLKLSSPKTLPAGTYIVTVTMEFVSINANLVTATILGTQCSCYKNANGYAAYRQAFIVGLTSETKLTSFNSYMQQSENVKFTIILVRLN